MKSILFLSLSLTISSAYATIHYTEVNEYVYVGTPLYYDLDLDGDNDFHFTAVDVGSSTGSIAFYVNSDKPTSQHAAEGTSDTLPKAYAHGAGMGTYHWQNVTGLLSSPTAGYFNSATSAKYLMVKFNDADDTYYGWFRIRKSGWSLIIEGYAYNDAPDEMIDAGETDPTGIAEISASDFRVAKFNTRMIAFQNCESYDNVEVFTTEGRKVAEINNPVAMQEYFVGQQDALLFVVFSKKGKHLFTARHFVMREY